LPIDEKDLNNQVSVSFGRAPYYAVYDTDTKDVEYIENTAASAKGGAGIKAAQFVVDSGAEVLITPRCGENAADVVSNAGIKMYKSEKVSAKENIDIFLENKLSFLNDIHEGFHGKVSN
jgi:predicted Fe-Mo cluster-binding NifX family protein